MSTLSLNEGRTLQSSPDDGALLLRSHSSALIAVWLVAFSAADYVRSERAKLTRKRLKWTAILLGAALVLTFGYGLISSGGSAGAMASQLLQFFWIVPLFALVLYAAIPVGDPEPDGTVSVLLDPHDYGKLGSLSADERAELFAIEDGEARYGRINELIALRLIREAVEISS